MQAGELRAHRDSKLRVEIRERLVHQEGKRLAHDRAAHRNPLALTAGQRSRAPVEQLLESQQPRNPVDALRDLRL